MTQRVPRGSTFSMRMPLSGTHVTYFIPDLLEGAQLDLRDAAAAIVKVQSQMGDRARSVLPLFMSACFRTDSALRVRPETVFAAVDWALHGQMPKSTEQLRVSVGTALLSRDMCWRDRFTWVGGASPIDAWLVPPPPEHISVLLEDLVAFFSRRQSDGLTRLILGVFQWLHIHPLIDGNGRFSRFLSLKLATTGGITLAGYALASLLAWAPGKMRKQWDDLRGGCIDFACERLVEVSREVASLAEELSAVYGKIFERYKAGSPHMSRIALERAVNVTLFTGGIVPLSLLAQDRKSQLKLRSRLLDVTRCDADNDAAILVDVRDAVARLEASFGGSDFINSTAPG